MPWARIGWFEDHGLDIADRQARGMGTEIAFGSFDFCIPHYWLGSSKILRHFVNIESPISFSGVPLTVVEEEEIVEFWAQHIQTINHIFQLKCHMEVPRCVHQCATRPSTILRQPFSVSFADSSI
jgi:hypothetical protein